MFAVSSIDTNVYSERLMDDLTVQSAENSSVPAGEQTRSVKEVEESNEAENQEYRNSENDRYSENNNVNLNDYYSKGDLLQVVSENVKKASADLSNAMASAVANGNTVQDACNIRIAKAAYEANCRVAKSTFEIAV